MDERPVVCLIGTDAETQGGLAVALHKPHFDTRCFSSVPQFLGQVSLTLPGCAILDRDIANDDKLHLLRQLHEANSPLALLVCGDTSDLIAAVSLLQHGAAALINDPFDVRSVLEVVERSLPLSSERYHKRQHTESIRERLSSMSPDEHKVLDLLLRGVPNKAIVRSLQMSMRTVDRRKHSILDKMRVSSVTEVAVLLGELEASNS